MRTQGLADGVGEHGPQRHSRKDEGAGGLIVDGKRQGAAEDATYRNGRQGIRDPAEAPTRAPVVLGQRAHASGAGGHKTRSLPISIGVIVA